MGAGSFQLFHCLGNGFLVFAVSSGASTDVPQKVPFFPYNLQTFQGACRKEGRS
jgi:hypothetical protein